MLNCLTYIAFVYWAVATVHTILPIDVAVCGADVSRGGLGALFNHAFGGDLDVDVESWRGFPCKSGLLAKLGFIMRRPAATVRHIMYGGGQDEPFVPILFVVPLMFAAVILLQRLGLRVMSDTAARTLLKFGVAIGCRSVILLQSLADPTKQSVYYKRYSKVEFCIIAWTAYIVELPVWHEAMVSGGTAVIILLLCIMFPGRMLPEVNPVNVATQAVAAAVLGVGHAYYLQRRRMAERGARAARSAAKVAPAMTQEEEQMQKQSTKQQQQQPSSTREEKGPQSTFTFAATAADNDSKPVDLAPSTSATATAARGAAVAAMPAAAAALLAQTATRPSASESPMQPSSVAVSLATLRRIHIVRARPYVSPARPCRFTIKIQHAHLSDLPPNLMAVVNSEVLARSGWQAVCAHAREGCVELVLDLRPLVATRPSYGHGEQAADDDRLAQPDQDRTDSSNNGAAADAAAAAAAPMDGAVLRELGHSIVAYLHSTGVIRPDREQSVLLQMGTDTIGLMWQPDAQTWVATEAVGLADGESASADTATSAAVASLVPTLWHLSPRVALWHGTSTRLQFTVLLSGPSTEEVLAGGGLLVRCASFVLPYSVLRVQPQTATAPPSLLVEVAVSDVPRSGLLLVEVRTSRGLLSAPKAVVVDYDPDVVSGLLAMAAVMDEESVGAFLHDYGTWLDFGLGHGMLMATASEEAENGEEEEDIAKRYVRDVLPDEDDILVSSDSAKCCASAAAASTADGVVQGHLPSVRLAGIGAGTGPVFASPSFYRMLNPWNLDSQHQELRDQVRNTTTAAGGGSQQPPPPPPQAMLDVAADLLGVCCRSNSSSNGGVAVADVADRLIACIIASNKTVPPADAFAALLNAVATPTNGGALHMAVAAGLSHVVDVIVQWYDRLHGAAGAKHLWLTRASCGVTPLHVAAAMPDGGAMAAWLLYKYDTVATLWHDATALTDDGLTPAALAAQLGDRWQLRLWQRASNVVRSVKHVLTPPPPLARAMELLWGFRDPPLERRFAEALSGQSVTILALYAAANAFLSLLALVKAVMYGNFETTTALAALAFHVPHAAPLLAWFCEGGGGGGGKRGGSGTLGNIHLASTAPTTANPTTTTATQHLSIEHPPPLPRLLAHLHARQATTFTSASPPPQTPITATAVNLLSGYGSGGRRSHSSVRTATLSLSRPLPSSPSLSRCSWRRLQTAWIAMHLCRAAAKAAVGLSLWPFSLPLDSEVFIARGGDIALEAVVRPLLEQVGLPARLLVSLVDAPAMLLLYHGVKRRHAGLVPRPLERVLVYQAVLLATTAAVSATNRARFLRAREVSAARMHQKKLGGSGAKAAARAAATRPCGVGGHSPSSSFQPPPSLPPFPPSPFCGGSAPGGGGGGGGGGSLGKAGRAMHGLSAPGGSPVGVGVGVGVPSIS